MKKNNNQTMPFKVISDEKVEVDFKCGNSSSDAGLLLLRESEKRIGLIQKFADIIPDQRHSGYIKRNVRQLLSQRVFQIAAEIASSLFI